MRFQIRDVENKLKEISHNLNASSILTFQLIISVFAFFQIWIFQYLSDDGNPNLIGRVSFRVADPPFMLNPENLTPILYKHYFGDWQNLMDVANQSNPYLIPEIGSQTPPLGNIFLRVLSILGPKYSFYIFLGVTLLIWIWLFHKALRNYQFLYTMVAVSLCFILTLPAIYSFDRGSLHIFAFGIIGIAWRKYLKEKYSFAGALFILAISMKPQLSIILLLLLLKLDFRNILRAIFGAFTINFLLLLIFFDQPIRSVIGFVKGTRFFATANSGGYILDSASLMGFISRRIEGAYGTDYALKWMSDQSPYLLVPSIILILVVVPIIFFNRINQRVKIFLILSLCSLLIPSSMHYTLIWASLAIIPFFSNQFNIVPGDSRGNDKDKIQKKMLQHIVTPIRSWQVSDFLSLFTITLLLSPTFAVYWTGARNTSIVRDLYPLMTAFTIFVAYSENFLVPLIKTAKSRKIPETESDGKQK